MNLPFDIVYDIEARYINLRRAGNSRDASIDLIKSDFHREMLDPEDRAQVFIGMARVLSKKKELTEELFLEAMKGFDELAYYFPETVPSLEREKIKICNIQNVGTEAKYRAIKQWYPEWQIGDIYYYLLNGEYPSMFGINGHCILLQKVDDYVNYSNRKEQILCLTLCEQGKEPQNYTEFCSLGISQFDWGTPEHFRYSMEVRSKRVWEKMQLKWFGHFPVYPLPSPAGNYTECYPIFPPDDPNRFDSLEICTCLHFKEMGLYYQKEPR